MKKKIRINGRWFEEDAAIQREVVDAFRCLFSDPGGWGPNLSGLDFNEISLDEVAKLEETFSTEEVYASISDLNGDKTPVLMVSQSLFGNSVEIFVKDELMGFFQEVP